MRVIEQCSKARTGHCEDCDDAVIVTQDFGAVVDGCTRRSSHRWGHARLGQIAARLVREGIENLPATADLPATAEQLTRRLFDFYASQGVAATMRESPSQRPAATLAMYSNARREVWLIGDCQCLVGRELHSQPMKVDQILSEVRALALQIEILSGKSEQSLLQEDIGRSLISPLLARQSVFQNNELHGEYSYGVIDGFPVPQRFCRAIPVPPSVQSIVLATDGYPAIFPTLRESEQHLADLLLTDPLCIRTAKSTKGLVAGHVSFDDRAFLCLEP